MLHTTYHFNSVRQTPSAFKSLSFKGKKGYSSPYIFQEMSPPITQSQTEFKKLLEKKVLPRPRIYGAIVYCSKPNRTSFILVQGRYTQKWSFPKGHMNKDEMPYNCALRELREETGLQLSEPIGGKRVGYGMYYTFQVEEELQLNPADKNEIINTKWVTLDEMVTLNVNSDVNAFIKLFRENDISFSNFVKELVSSEV